MAEPIKCPFCGRIPTVEDCGTNKWFVKCQCGIAQDKLYHQRCDAVRAWNRRKSIQPDVTDINVGDTIYRQAAIEHLKKRLYETALNNVTEHPYYEEMADNRVSVWLKEVPSAQPENTETHSCDSERTETHDLVSRQVVIDAVKHHMNNVSGGNDEYYIAHRHIIELLQIVPTAEPESHREWYMHGYRDAQRWIQVTERLPDEADYKGCSECIDGAVWYYTDKGAMGLGYYYKSTKAWSTTDDESPYGNVIAWLPLPEPYAERRQE